MPAVRQRLFAHYRLLAFCLLVASPVLALDGRRLALVVNANNPGSLAVANEYVYLRGIPPGNVVYLEDVPAGHTISVAAFRERILRPLLTTLRQRQLLRQIDVIAYSSGFPIAVNCKSELDVSKHQQLNNALASLTGLTYLYQLSLAPNDSYVGPHTNFYAQIPRQLSSTVRPLGKAESAAYRDVLKSLAKGVPKLTTAERRKALATLTLLARGHPGHIQIQYNLACLNNLAGNQQAALHALTAAVAAGWHDHAHTSRDPDLSSLQGLAQFNQLLAKMRDAELNVATHGFASSRGWRRGGQPVAPDAADYRRSPRYLLCVMLGADYAHGIDTIATIRYLRRAAKADFTSPSGTIYFMANKDVRSTTREWARDSARRLIVANGVDAVVKTGKFPDGASDVAGYMGGFAVHAVADSGTNFVPGAIADHLTSFGGALHTKSQTKMTEFLKLGAAGTAGTVSEPYALQFKFADEFLQVHYVRGATMAEAYYQSVRSPYHLLIMGDPLCAPWAIPPTVALAQEPPASVSGTITLEPRSVAPVHHYELYVNGRQFGAKPPGGSFSLPTEKLAEGFHELTITAVSDNAIRTRASLHRRLQVNNRNHKLTAIATTTTIPTTGNLQIEVTSDGASRIAAFHNGRQLAASDTANATLTIPATKIGAGSAHIQVVATINGHLVRAAPILTEIK